MFDHNSKRLDVRQKIPPTRRNFTSLPVVWKYGQRRSFVFDIICQEACKVLQDNRVKDLHRLLLYPKQYHCAYETMHKKQDASELISKFIIRLEIAK